MHMEWLVHAGAIGLLLLLVVFDRFHYEPNELSQFEVARRVKAGDAHAAAEARRRLLLPPLAGLRAIVVVKLAALFAVLLAVIHEWWVGLLLIVAYGLVGQVLIAKGWVDKPALWLQRCVEP